MVADAAAGGVSEHEAAALTSAVKAEALRIGFDLVGVVSAVAPATFADFQEWLRQGFAGEMKYLGRREEAYAHPRHVMPTVRTVIMLAANYRTVEPTPAEGSSGRVSRYAWNDGDYHTLMRERLEKLAGFLHAERPGGRTRAIVDTAPLLERDFARTAGLGWFGKNTMLINKRQGSWLFLAGLLTDVELKPDAPHESSHCGTCTRCLEACPTDAFPAPHVLDARKCISYLTIELKGPIPTELREGIGDWLFGCDICQDVCPWNKKAPHKDDVAFRPRSDLNPADLLSLLDLDEIAFERTFGQSALSRPGRAGVLRNAAIVLGNQQDERSIPALDHALCDAEPVLRGAAAWALGKINGPRAQAALKSRLAVEDNAAVLLEIQQALAQCPTNSSWE
jgi:epoxyqueuosine reductase